MSVLGGLGGVRPGSPPLPFSCAPGAHHILVTAVDKDFKIILTTKCGSSQSIYY